MAAGRREPGTPNRPRQRRCSDAPSRAGSGESRRGISPPRAPRSVREPLGSYGSRCSVVDIQKAPMGKQEWVGTDDPRKPVPCPRCPCSKPLVLVAAPSDQVGVYPLQGAAQGRPIEVAVVVDPALDVWIKHPCQIP